MVSHQVKAITEGTGKTLEAFKEFPAKSQGSNMLPLIVYTDMTIALQEVVLEIIKNVNLGMLSNLAGRTLETTSKFNNFMFISVPIYIKQEFSLRMREIEYGYKADDRNLFCTGALAMTTIAIKITKLAASLINLAKDKMPVKLPVQTLPYINLALSIATISQSFYKITEQRSFLLSMPDKTKETAEKTSDVALNFFKNQFECPEQIKKQIPNIAVQKNQSKLGNKATERMKQIITEKDTHSQQSEQVLTDVKQLTQRKVKLESSKIFCELIKVAAMGSIASAASPLLVGGLFLSAIVLTGTNIIYQQTMEKDLFNQPTAIMMEQPAA